MIKRVTIIDGKLIGNTRYDQWDIKTVPGKYLKWLAHSQYCDQTVRDYYLTVRDPDTDESTCIHCNVTKKLSEMIPAQESWHIKGLFQKSNVCQDCFDRKLALVSAENICKSYGREFKEEDISEEFINAKIQLTRLKRVINQKTK